MPFVNEYVSDEDIKKYHLNDIWDQYHPLRKGEYFGGQRPDWTIDRKDCIFLLVLDVGVREYGNQVKFLLCYKDHHITAILELLPTSSVRLNSNPFLRHWKVRDLNIPKKLAVPRKEIVERLNKALQSYGYWGAQQQLPNTVVTLSD